MTPKPQPTDDRDRDRSAEDLPANWEEAADDDTVVGPRGARKPDPAADEGVATHRRTAERLESGGGDGEG